MTAAQFPVLPVSAGSVVCAAVPESTADDEPASEANASAMAEGHSH